ncbi:hypothetical protein LTR49_024849 [Elasticomyces elasticus]|nr:hypothetical protein LTR49_024849 [Elasticomyces elasticus]KAK5757496.1 hypothetical protein LTS12_012454 [Elasticomyces elasticus]
MDIQVGFRLPTYLGDDSAHTKHLIKYYRDQLGEAANNIARSTSRYRGKRKPEQTGIHNQKHELEELVSLAKRSNVPEPRPDFDVNTAVTDHAVRATVALALLQLTKTKAVDPLRHFLDTVPDDLRVAADTNLRIIFDKKLTRTKITKHILRTCDLLQRTTPASPALLSPLNGEPTSSPNKAATDWARDGLTHSFTEQVNPVIMLQTIAGEVSRVTRIPRSRTYHPLPPRPDFLPQEFTFKQTNAVPDGPLRSDRAFDSLQRDSNSLSFALSTSTPAPPLKRQKLGKDLQDLAVYADQDNAQSPCVIPVGDVRWESWMRRHREDTQSTDEQGKRRVHFPVGRMLQLPLLLSELMRDFGLSDLKEREDFLPEIGRSATLRLCRKLIHMNNADLEDSWADTDCLIEDLYTEQESVSESQLTEAADFDAEQESISESQLTEAADFKVEQDFDAEQESVSESQPTEAADFDAEQESVNQPQLTETADFDAEQESVSQPQPTRDVEFYADQDYIAFEDVEEGEYTQHQTSCHSNQDVEERAYTQHQTPHHFSQNDEGEEYDKQEEYTQHQTSRHSHQDVEQEEYNQHQTPHHFSQNDEGEEYDEQEEYTQHQTSRHSHQDIEQEEYTQHQTPHHFSQNDEEYTRHQTSRQMDQPAYCEDVLPLDVEYNQEEPNTDAAAPAYNGSSFDQPPPVLPVLIAPPAGSSVRARLEFVKARSAGLSAFLARGT